MICCIYNKRILIYSHFFQRLNNHAHRIIQLSNIGKITLQIALPHLPARIFQFPIINLLSLNIGFIRQIIPVVRPFLYSFLIIHIEKFTNRITWQMWITRIKTDIPFFTFRLILLNHFNHTLCQPMCTGLHFISRIISSHHPTGILPYIIRQFVLFTPIIIAPFRHIIIKSKIFR